jgi:hypothetical protein
MKFYRSTLLALLLSTTGPVLAQSVTFTETHPVASLPGNDFTGLEYARTAFADIDDDDDQDLLICGYNAAQELVTEIYRNDGTGGFDIDLVQTVADIGLGDVDFADVDNDGDQDYFISGHENWVGPAARLYLNDGTGFFSPAGGSVFTPNDNGTVDFADVDNDGDPDLFLTGFDNTSPGQSIAELYLNDGTGGFTLVAGAPFTGIINGDCAFLDLDADGDSDLVYTGKVYPGDSLVSRAYVNDGSGGYTAAAAPPFPGLNVASLATADVDLDGDTDLFVNGDLTQLPYSVNNLYLNNGDGSLSESAFNAFFNLFRGDAGFMDFDGDGDPDLVLAGLSSSVSDYHTKVYRNEGHGYFIPLPSASIPGICRGSVEGADIDSDGYDDILLIGRDTDNAHTARLFLSGVEPMADPFVANAFSTPSDINSCTGTIEYSMWGGTPWYYFNPGNGFYGPGNGGTSLEKCPGLYSVLLSDSDANAVMLSVVVASDSNYISNVPVVEPVPLAYLSATVENCDIDYETIEFIYIDTFTFLTADSINVIWAVIDASDTTFIPTSFLLTEGYGDYFLQLGLYCLQKSTESFFVATEAVRYGEYMLSTLDVHKEEDAIAPGIFPNPVTDAFVIRCPEIGGRLTIFDLNGNVLLTRTIENNEKIGLEKLANGVYVVELVSGQLRTVERVVKY